MAKALGTLLFRGIVGVVSIAATAVITVLMQRYLYEKMGTPALILPPPVSSPSRPAQPEVEEQPVEATQPDLGSPAEPEGDASTGVVLEEQGDRKNKIMEQFWDKLNR